MRTTQTPAALREGEARGAAGHKCDWAACSNSHATLEDGYWHCDEHLPAHRNDGKPEWPSLPAGSNRLAPCGTHGAFRRHKRNGEQCVECQNAYDVRSKQSRLAALVDLPLDEAAILSVIEGRWVRLTQPERLEAVRRMKRAGHTWADITKRLKLSGTTAARLIREAA